MELTKETSTGENCPSCKQGTIHIVYCDVSSATDKVCDCCRYKETIGFGKIR